MIRVPTPADLNDTTARHPRTLLEAFPCDASQAQAVFRAYDVCHYGARWWACAALLAVIASIVIVATA